MTKTSYQREWDHELGRLDRHGNSERLTPDTADLGELMSTYRLPAISIAVAGPASEMWCAGFGTTTTEHGAVVTSRTMFQACSISKHVAAFGAVRLADDGVIDLDGDIAEHLTSWQLPAAESGWRPRVTVRQLLAHTAGLSYNWFRGYEAGEPTPTLGQVLRGEPPANTQPVRPALLPGSKFRYSGSHYAVLQQLMVDVTKTPFEELMRTLVLEPVGMADSSYSQQFPAQRPGLVALGHFSPGTPVTGGWRVLPEMAGAGLWTTPADLTRLELEIATAAAGESSLVSQDLAQQMLTPQVPDGMGLGTELRTSGGRLRFGHTGSNVGYCCYSFAWPDAGAAVAVMANSDGAPEVILSILAAAQRRYAPASDAREGAEPSEVAGRYLLADGGSVDIEADGERLNFTVTGGHAVQLTRSASGRYRLPGLDCEVSFAQEDGSPVMRISQEGSPTAARRAS
jgi:CubicO group peptidase (beta-lactamase class C family)